MYNWYLLGGVAWVVFLLSGAFVASKKGHNFFVFMLVGLFLPGVSLIIAALLPNKNETAADRAANRAAEKALEKEEHRA